MPIALWDFRRHTEGERNSKNRELNWKSCKLTIILKLWRSMCVCMRDRMATQLHTGYRSLHRHKQRASAPQLKSIYPNDHRITSCFFYSCATPASGAEHQPAGSVSWS